MYSVLRISVLVVFVVSTVAIAPKSFNLALETNIRIRSDENAQGLIHNISRFIDKLKYALPARIDQISRRILNEQPMYLTNFLNEVAQVIFNYNYNQTYWLFKNIYEDIKYYFRYKGSSLTDIIRSPDLQRYLLRTLKDFYNSKYFKMKVVMENFMRNAAKEDSVAYKFGEFLNDFYDRKDVPVMKKIVSKLKNCTTEQEFAKVVAGALHVLVIKHYDRLNYTIRTKISDEIDRLTKYAIQRRFPGFESFMDTFPFISALNASASINSSGNINTEVSTSGLQNFTALSTTESIFKDPMMLYRITEKPDDLLGHKKVSTPAKHNVHLDIERIKQKYESGQARLIKAKPATVPTVPQTVNNTTTPFPLVSKIIKNGSRIIKKIYRKMRRNVTLNANATVSITDTHPTIPALKLNRSGWHRQGFTGYRGTGRWRGKKGLRSGRIETTTKWDPNNMPMNFQNLARLEAMELEDKLDALNIDRK